MKFMLKIILRSVFVGRFVGKIPEGSDLDA